MNGILPITLEDALAGEFGDNAYGDAQNVANMSLADIALECADAYGELCDIESNLMTFEAATKIKKAKSGKKKVKVTKKKMSAKAAKAAKKSGKVRRITRESDSELDGGTGPLPTTGDTNGLTDSDLDADPDATVEVTSADDYQPEQADIIGVEGVDFEIEYEDPMIQELTFEADNLLKKMGRGLQEFASKVVQFFQKIYYKINDKLKLDRKWLTEHKDEITQGLKDNASTKIKNFPERMFSAAKTGDDKTIEPGCRDAIDAAAESVVSATTALNTFADAIQKLKDDKSDSATLKAEIAKDTYKALFPGKKDAESAGKYAIEVMLDMGKDKSEITVGDAATKLGFTYDDILSLVKGGETVDKALKNLKSAEQKAKRLANYAGASSGKMSALKRGFANAQKLGNLYFRAYVISRSCAMKIAKAACKETAEEDDDID